MPASGDAQRSNIIYMVWKTERKETVGNPKAVQAEGRMLSTGDREGEFWAGNREKKELGMSIARILNLKSVNLFFVLNLHNCTPI